MSGLAAPLGLAVAGPLSDAVGSNTWFVVGGIALLGLFVWTETKVREPLVDLGFFRNDVFSADRLLENLREAGTVGVLEEGESAVTVIVSATKVSFVSVPYEILFPGQPYRSFGLADPRDIASTAVASSTAS